MADKPPLQGDREIAEWMERNHCSGFATEYAREAQRDAVIKWFNQWLEEHEAMSPKVSNDGKRFNIPLRLEEK